MSRQQFVPLCGICHEPYNEPIIHPDCVSLSESVRDDLEDLEFLEKRMSFGPRQKRQMLRVSTALVTPLPTLDENMPVISAFGDRTKTFSRRPSVEQKTHNFELRRRSTILQDIRRPGKRRASVQIDPLSQEIKVDGKDIFTTYDAEKPANSRLRWNLLWLVFCLLAPYPLWLTFIPGGCTLSYEITILMNVLLTVNFLYTTILCWKYMWRMIRAFNTPFWQELDPETRSKLRHIVVMPTYKEPVELLCETISSIANQTVAGSIIMVVGMEERTPDQEMKRQIIRERFEGKFCALIFSVHPTGIPGEIPGACSNRNHAARTAVKYMISEGLLPVDPVTRELELDFCTISVCDADTTYYYRYFENLSWAFLNEPPETRYQVCWQSPLFYNIALDKRWFFTRAMGILRSYFMIGFLIGGSINTMSIYSMSLGLLVKSQFFHPGYQMDDIIYTLSAMRATGVRIQIRTIDIPTLSGPTSGDNLLSEFREWVIQATRWTIGAAEVFHYFFVKLLKKNYFLPGLAYFWWFVYYYGFVLCVSGLVAISNLIVQFIGLALEEYSIETCKPCQSWFNLADDSAFYSWIMPSFLLFNYGVVFSTAFLMDALVSQILALDEQINPLRNLMHWLSSQIVLWVYCLVEYRAIFRIAYYGKEVCGHKASEKHALVGVNPHASLVQPRDPPESEPRQHSAHSNGSYQRYSSSRSVDSLQDLFDASGGSLANEVLAPVEETSHGEDSSNELEECFDEATKRRGSDRESLKAVRSLVENRADMMNELSPGILVFEASQPLSLDGSKLTLTDERSSSDFKDSSLCISLDEFQADVVDEIRKDQDSCVVKEPSPNPDGLVASAKNDDIVSPVLTNVAQAVIGGSRSSFTRAHGNERSSMVLDGLRQSSNDAGSAGKDRLERGIENLPQPVDLSAHDSVDGKGRNASPSDAVTSTTSKLSVNGSDLVVSADKVEEDSEFKRSDQSSMMLTIEDEKSGSESILDVVSQPCPFDELRPTFAVEEPASETNASDYAELKLPIVTNGIKTWNGDDERKETGTDDLRVSLHSITSRGDESTGDFEINMKFVQQTNMLRQSIASVDTFHSERIDL